MAGIFWFVKPSLNQIKFVNAIRECSSPRRPLLVNLTPHFRPPSICLLPPFSLRKMPIEKTLSALSMTATIVWNKIETKYEYSQQMCHLKIEVRTSLDRCFLLIYMAIYATQEEDRIQILVELACSTICQWHVQYLSPQLALGYGWNFTLSSFIIVRKIRQACWVEVEFSVCWELALLATSIILSRGIQLYFKKQFAVLFQCECVDGVLIQFLISSLD